MKKISILLLCLLLCFSFVACGGGDTPAVDSSDNAGEDVQNDGQSVSQQSGNFEGIPEAWVNTKIGKFYSQFDGEIYMEYEADVEGMHMTIITATDGNRHYSQALIDGMSAGVTIMDEEYVYSIDHDNKMIIKMALEDGMDGGEILPEVNDAADIISGTKEINGKTYDTESFELDGDATIFCFDGDELVYLIAQFEGTENLITIKDIDNKFDKKLLELPVGYEEYTM